MKNVRFLLLAVAAATVVVTALVGLAFGAIWAVTVAVAGLICVVLGSAYVQTKTLQTATQRLAGLQKQNKQAAVALQTLLAAPRPDVDTTTVTLSPEVRQAFNDLTLASRALTVPQAHFDQLLRTISANTVRTEMALGEALDEIRLLSPGREN